MNFFSFLQDVFYKQILFSVSFNSDFDAGVFSNDLSFFHFEIYFLFSVIVLLIFFVSLSNKKMFFSFYLKVSRIFLDLLVFVILVLFVILNTSVDTSFYLFSGFYFQDFSTIFFKNLILFAFLFYLFSVKAYIFYFKDYDFEFVLVLFLSLFSSTLILNANDLFSLFFIIELQSLTFYILVSSKQTSSFSTESGLKYFILGCFSSGIILFGISLIYGFTGLLNYDDLHLFFSSLSFFGSGSSSFIFSGLLLGLLFLTVGLLFKFGSVPFHM